MRQGAREWLRANPLWVDLAIVVFVVAIPLTVLSLVTMQDVRYNLILVVPLVLRRRAPVASFTLISLLLLNESFVSAAPRWGDVALLLGLYSIAAFGPRWAIWGGLATGFLGAFMATQNWILSPLTAPESLRMFAFLSTLCVAAWTLGMLSRTRRAYVAGLVERASQLERDAAQQSQIATTAERARIAREMHDVVAHSLSVMVVQADGALYASQKRPAAAAETLKTISQTGRTSLAEMRKLLGLLRGDEGQSAQLAPMPNAGDIAALVAQVRVSGISIDLNVVGDLDRLGRANGLTAYRIVQEALTNTLRHGGPGVAAVVDIRVDDNSVRICIDDDGRGSSVADDGNGLGIRGIRERIALHNGDIEAGPRPGGGFRVETVLPLDDQVALP